jgi:hypothetical protein
MMPAVGPALMMSRIEPSRDDSAMSATIIILPVVARPNTHRGRGAQGASCPRCFDLRFVTFGRMNEAQQRWAPAKAVLPCLDCAGAAQVIPFRASDGERRVTAQRTRFVVIS